MVYAKSTWAEWTTPATLALTSVSKSVSAVSFGDLDLNANHVGGDVSWTPQVGDVNIKTYETYFATGAAGSGGALAGSKAVGTKVEADTSLAPAASGAPPPTTTSFLLAALNSRCEDAGR